MAKLSVVGVYDSDQKAVAAVFDTGSEKEQKAAAQNYIDRVHLHTGDAPERDLTVVAIKEV